jgi:NAD(P)H-hydrate epimerase
MRQWEAATWAAGRSEAEVIRSAAGAVAAVAREVIPESAPVIILAGRGNNGADARGMREFLPRRALTVVDVNDPAAAAAQLPALLADRRAWIVDGLFGIGLNRPLEGAWAALVEQINAARLPVLAVDVPSGLDADTGLARGAAVRAAVTVTLAAPKRGLLSAGAAEFVGRLVVQPDIGLVACPFSGEVLWTLPSDFSGFPPRRADDAHKGTHGHVTIVAGSVGYHGASVLAARGAQRAMPGLVTLVTAPDIYPAVAAQLQSVMVAPWTPDVKFPEERGALLFGPGLAARDLPRDLVQRARRAWQAAPVPVVFDASALAWLDAEPRPFEEIRIVTPHPGEAARLLGTTVEEIQADRVAAVRELSRHFGECWVVLKGRHTVIGRRTGPVFLNPSGNPQLAQGGAGDVLAGYLAGLLAQPPLQLDPLTALRYGVWAHGAAADALAARWRSWIIEELAGVLGTVSP